MHPKISKNTINLEVQWVLSELSELDKDALPETYELIKLVSECLFFDAQHTDLSTSPAKIAIEYNIEILNAINKYKLKLLLKNRSPS